LNAAAALVKRKLANGQTTVRTLIEGLPAGSDASAQGGGGSGGKVLASITTKPPGSNQILDEDTVSAMAEQYLAGDKSVLQNLGRGVQGSGNVVKLRAEITRQAKAQGLTGRDIAAQMADFTGIVAGERAAGTRTANIEMAASEAQKIIPIARAASDAIDRVGFVPLARAIQNVQAGSNNVALKKFVTANNALINIYARAISPTGVPNIPDKEHAREMLSTAMNKQAYNGVLDQMEQEISAARAAPADVRGELRRAVGGGAVAPSAPTPPGIPAGSKRIGKTPDGHPVYADANGQKFVAQ
jgi:hypothetical protein